MGMELPKVNAKLIFGKVVSCHERSTLSSNMDSQLFDVSKYNPTHQLPQG